MGGGRGGGRASPESACARGRGSPGSGRSCCLRELQRRACHEIAYCFQGDLTPCRFKNLYSNAMSFLSKAKCLAESAVREATGKQDYHFGDLTKKAVGLPDSYRFGDLTKKALGLPTHSDEEKQAAASDWIVLRDVASGRTYYQNNRLGVTQWDPPCPLPMQPHQHQQHPLPPEWETLFDASGRPYYVNHATRLSTYERPVPISSGGCFSAVPPPLYAAFSRSAGAAADPARLLIGAIKFNQALDMTCEQKRAHIGELPARKGIFGSQKVSNGWEEMRDQNGRIFFQNTMTGEISYVRPVVDAAGSSQLGQSLASAFTPTSGDVFAFIEHVLLD